MSSHVRQISRSNGSKPSDGIAALAAPDDVSLQHSQMDFATIQAWQPQHIRRVQILAPAICQVVQGHKVVYWQGQRFEVTPQHLLVFPAGAVVDIENHPDQQLYKANIVSFPLAFIQHYQLKHQATLSSSESSADLFGGSSVDARRYSQLPGLTLPLDNTLGFSWNTLIAAVQQQLPASLQQHHAEGLLLAMQGMPQLQLLLTVNQQQLRHRLQQIFLQKCDYDWQLYDAAQRLYMGESTLRRKLAEEQTSFKQVLDEVRFAVALGMLQTTVLPISHIAERCGYLSASRFAVKFRQIYGLAPSEIRGR